MNQIEKLIVEYLNENKIILDRGIVAFSGGIDSSFIAFILKKYYKNLLLVFVKTELIPENLLKIAINKAKIISLPLKIINLKLLNIDEIRYNSENRCYFCKKFMYKTIKSQYENIPIFDGTNYSDTFSYRPGIRAIEELKILTPLKDCKITKNEIIEFLDKKKPELLSPSDNCLATKFPYGTDLKEVIYAKKDN